MRRARLNPPVLYRHLLSLAMIALAAVLAGLMFDALVALGASAGAALGTAALLMLSPRSSSFRCSSSPSCSRPSSASSSFTGSACATSGARRTGGGSDA